MAKNRSYRVSEEFVLKLDQIRKYYEDDLLIKFSNEQLFDEMIDLYYATVFLQSNIAISRLVKNEVDSSLEQFTKMNAQFHNAILEEMKKISK